MSSSGSILLGASIIALSTPFLIARWLRPKATPGIPHHPIVSFWGDLPEIGADTKKYGSIFEPGSFLERSYEQLGPVFEMFLGPLKKSLVVTDMQECEDLLLRHGSKLDIVPDQADTFHGIIPYGSVGLRTDDERWRRHRKAIATLTSSKYISSVGEIVGVEALRLISYWKLKVAIRDKVGATSFPCQADFMYSSLDIIAQLIAGRSLGMVENAMQQSANSRPVPGPHGSVSFDVTPTPLFMGIRYLFSCLGGPGILPSWIYRAYLNCVTRTPKYRREYGAVMEYINSCLEISRQEVREALAIGEELGTARSFMDMFAQAEGESADAALSQEELRDEVIQLLFAGHDTTSMSLQWACKYFADTPEVQRRLRAELLSSLNDSPDKRPLTFVDVSSPATTPYLEAVMHEILRCARIAVLVRRSNNEPITILGHEIPAGADIWMNMPAASTHSTPDKESDLRARDSLRSESSLKQGLSGRALFTETDKFNPSRWLDGEGHFDPKAGFSAPFGLGIRSCPGKPVALVELKIFLATMNLAFFLDKVPAELAGNQPVVHVTRAPVQAYINLKSWKEVDA